MNKLAALLVAQGLALGYIATRVSASPDEYANLAAGLFYLENGSFSLYNVNPPLVKIFAALPAWVMGLRCPELSEQHRPEWTAGADLALQAAAEQALIYARWIASVFVVLGTIGVYRLGSMAGGGFQAALLWAASPITLGYGALLSFDVSAAGAGAFAAWALWLWSREQTWLNAVQAASLLAIAVLIKSVWIGLIGAVCLPLIFDRTARTIFQVLTIAGVSAVLVAACYHFDLSAFFDGIRQQRQDFRSHGELAGWYYVIGYALKLPLGFIVLWLAGIVFVRSWDRFLFMVAIPIVMIAFLSSLNNLDHWRYAIVVFGIMCATCYPATGWVGKLLLVSSLSGVLWFPFCHPFGNAIARIGFGSAGEVLQGSADDWYLGWWEARDWIREQHEPVCILQDLWTNTDLHRIPAVDRCPDGEALLLISKRDRALCKLDWDAFQYVGLVGHGVECFRLRPLELPESLARHVKTVRPSATTKVSHHEGGRE